MKAIWARIGLSGQVIGVAIVLMAAGILAAQLLLLHGSNEMLVAEQTSQRRRHRGHALPPAHRGARTDPPRGGQADGGQHRPRQPRPDARRVQRRERLRRDALQRGHAHRHQHRRQGRQARHRHQDDEPGSAPDDARRRPPRARAYHDRLACRLLLFPAAQGCLGRHRRHDREWPRSREDAGDDRGQDLESPC